MCLQTNVETCLGCRRYSVREVQHGTYVAQHDVPSHRMVGGHRDPNGLHYSATSLATSAALSLQHTRVGRRMEKEAEICVPPLNDLHGIAAARAMPPPAPRMRQRLPSLHRDALLPKIDCVWVWSRTMPEAASQPSCLWKPSKCWVTHGPIIQGRKRPLHRTPRISWPADMASNDMEA